MMGKDLTPAKVLLLAAYLAAQSDIGKLASLAVQHAYVLRPEILLRILLTYLPETVEPLAYVDFLRDLSDGQLRSQTDLELDTTSVDKLSDENATKKAKKLRLLPLSKDKIDSDQSKDLVREFIVQRTYRVNSEVGALSQLPELLQPFIDDSPLLKQWAISTVFPFVRRNCEYHTDSLPKYTLSEFEKLPDRSAAIYLLSESTDGDGEATGRDLRGIIAPWIHNEARWKREIGSEKESGESCPGWEQVQDTILSWATKSWINAAGAITYWDGPQDAYFGKNLTTSLSDGRTQYLQKTHATTAMACIYSITETSEEALRSSYQICCAARQRLDETEPLPVLEDIMSNIALLPSLEKMPKSDPKIVTFMRHDLLKATNPLTSPTTESLNLITALTISAFISTSLGVPWPVRKAGDLLFIRDEREQKGELSKLLRAISSKAPRDDDGYWKRSRDAVLWLSNWGRAVKGTESPAHGRGPLGMVSREHIETEILKALLSKSSMTP